jgi:nucleoid-associated protein YgaU
VKAGDSLSVIAGRYWGDVLLWPILYKPNAKTIGPDYNLIKPGQQLVIPNIQNYSPQQKESARQQGRNWH